MKTSPVDSVTDSLTAAVASVAVVAAVASVVEVKVDEVSDWNSLDLDLDLDSVVVAVVTVVVEVDPDSLVVKVDAAASGNVYSTFLRRTERNASPTFCSSQTRACAYFPPWQTLVRVFESRPDQIHALFIAAPERLQVKNDDFTRYFPQFRYSPRSSLTHFIR